MAKRMLIDAAHPEETRVVVLNGHRLEEFDFETSTKKQIKGNIYLAKVTRVEPSLQAAFVEYGGNRHGFLAFGEIHPDYYRIPVADRRAALDADREAEAAADEREERHVEGGENGVIEPPHEHHDIEQPDFEPHDHLEADDHEHDDHDHDHDHTHDHGHDHDQDIGHLAERSTAEILRDADTHDHAEETHDDRFAEPSASAPYEGAPSDTMAPSAEPEFPVGDAFAEDDAVQSGEALAPEHGDAAAMPSGEFAPSEDGEPHLETAAPAVPLETVGGDEIEETTRRRARPHRHYKIQEVIKRRQIMLVQVTKEERGNKGAALTTYISLAGRYCVLMPNTPRGGGVSRKITSMQDRRRLKELMDDLEVPEGMGVIVRTAGSERSKVEIKRDFEYLIRLWDEIRELTLRSTAPALIYEEGNLIKRTIRDLYARDIDEVLVDGKEGYETAKSFMRMLMPTHSKRVKFYNDPSVPLFHRFQVEGQLDAIHSPTVQLRSGGYIVINPTEALVAIDVNSGRSTRERNIEETAFKTNLEAAEEIARQLRLRDLAGLIVIDFIDMEEHRNNGGVERRVKDAMRHDRARIQLGRISPFGLLELSRQRLRPSLLEASTQPCPHCNGTGHIRSTESTALHVLRAIEEEGMRRRSAEITVAVPTAVALYILNQKRATLQLIETRCGFHVTITEDDTLVPPAFRLERGRAFTPAEIAALPVPQPVAMPPEEEDDIVDEEEVLESEAEGASAERHEHRGESHDRTWPVPADASEGEQPWEDHGEAASGESSAQGDGHGHPRRRRRRRRRGGERERGGRDSGAPIQHAQPGELGAVEGEAEEQFSMPLGEESAAEMPVGEAQPSEASQGEAQIGENGERKRRRRGRRGGRRRRRGPGGETLPGDAAPGEFNAAEGFEENAAEAGEHDDAPEHAHEDAPEAAPSFATQDVAAAEPPPRLYTEEPAAPDVHLAPEPDVRAEAPANSAEAERAPAAYNVPPPHDVSGPTDNPRKGWWRRLTK